MRYELEDISVSYGELRALDQINLRLPVSGLLGLAGPNGSGKSTLLDVLSGFRHPSSGEVRLDGRPLSFRQLPKVFCRLHQSLVVVESLSVAEMLLVSSWSECRCKSPLMWNSLPLKIVDSIPFFRDVLEILHEIDIHEFNKPLGQLSWGQARVVALCVVVLTNSPAVLLDEPLAGLPAEMKGFVGRLLRRVARDRLVLVVEHDLSRLIEMCGEIIVLKEGRLVDMRPSRCFSESSIVQLWER